MRWSVIQDSELARLHAEQQSKPLKEQWVRSILHSPLFSSSSSLLFSSDLTASVHWCSPQMQALQMRVGMLKMGGFLHAGYDGVVAADQLHQHDYSIAK